MSILYWLLSIPYLGNVYSLLVIGYSLFRWCLFPNGYWLYPVYVSPVTYRLLAIPYLGNVYALLAAIGYPLSR